METVKKIDPAPEFDAFAEDYDAALGKGLAISGESKDFFAAGRLKWLAKWLNKTGVRPDSALDFGCGTGSATPHMFEHLPIRRLTGTDPSEKSLAVAESIWSGQFPVTFRLTGSAAPDLHDLAYCNGVFHHIPPSDRAAALTEVFNSLAPGGFFAFWENNPWNPVTRFAMSRVPFDRDAVLVWPHQARRLLREAGFAVLLTHYVFFFPRALSALRAIEPALCHVPFGGQYLVLAQKPGHSDLNYPAQ